jgi:hypothetical protein
VISLATGVESEGVNMTEWASEIGKDNSWLDYQMGDRPNFVRNKYDPQTIRAPYSTNSTPEGRAEHSLGTSGPYTDSIKWTGNQIRL